MEMKLEVNDLFSHMVLLGIAQIVSWNEDDAVTLCWKNPEMVEVDHVLSSLSIDEVAQAVWDFKELVKSERDIISKKVAVDSKENPTYRSPLSPRIGPLGHSNLCAYFDTRIRILDSVEQEDLLLSKMVGSLGLPAYWEHECLGKKKPTLDEGASKWEMSNRRSGLEFFTNEYLDATSQIDEYSIEEIKRHLCGDTKTYGKDSYVCGFHEPSKVDVLMAWIAYQGLSSFPTRPVSDSDTRASLSVSTIESKLGGKSKIWFVLPVSERRITLEKYVSLCRSNALTEYARQDICSYELPQSGKQMVHCRLDANYLLKHGVKRAVVFERLEYKVSKNEKYTSYWALPGKVISIE